MSDVMETSKSAKPILFSAAMVRALLDGRKTQTRRIMKSQPYTLRTEGFGYPTKAGGFVSLQSEHCLNECPYGKPGDRLWVRESYVLQCDVEGEDPPHTDGRPIQRPTPEEEEYADWSWSQPHYRATDPTPDLVCTKKSHKNCDICMDPWRNSMFMPRWASRITLEITEVRVQRLQEISEEDARAEGSDTSVLNAGDRHFARGWFHTLWESINGEGAWDANPWVWAVSFAATPETERLSS